MSFGVVVNGISIPDKKVIAVHDLAEQTNAAYVGSQVGLLKSQVLEVRKWLRDGIAEEIDRSRKQIKAIPPKAPKITKVFEKKPVEKPKPATNNPAGRKPSALEVLAVIAESRSRVFQKDIMQTTGFNGRKDIQTILKGLREKKLVEYKYQGTYSPTLEGINHLRLRDPDCKPHEKALIRARKSAYGVTLESDPVKPKKEKQQGVTWYCTDCNQKEGFHADYCSRVKHAAKKLTESIDKQSGAIDDHLADIDSIFEKQAIQKLETQVELLNKIHALTGKLAEEMKQSLAEVKTFLGSSD